MMPRPSSYSPALGELICERISDGMSLREACRDEMMPGRETVRRWLRDDPAFEKRYAQAIQQRSDAFLEDIIDISHDATNDWMDRRRADGTIERVPNPEVVARSKLRINTLQWAMSKCAPRKYGQRVEFAGDPDRPLVPTDAVDVARRIAFMFSQGIAEQERPSKPPRED